MPPATARCLDALCQQRCSAEAYFEAAMRLPSGVAQYLLCAFAYAARYYELLPRCCHAAALKRRAER